MTTIEPNQVSKPNTIFAQVPDAFYSEKRDYLTIPSINQADL